MNDQERLLTIFLRLQSGAHLAKTQLADEFGVSEKTIQRDFSLTTDGCSRTCLRYEASY